MLSGPEALLIVGPPSPGLFASESLRRPNWVNETDSLWYQWTDGEGRRFELVLPAGPTRRSLFDHQRMAEFITAAAGVAQMAVNLVGHLMLAFSDNDDNVHPANTIRLGRALEEANKRFDLVLVPGQAHSDMPP